MVKVFNTAALCESRLNVFSEVRARWLEGLSSSWKATAAFLLWG